MKYACALLGVVLVSLTILNAPAFAASKASSKKAVKVFAGDYQGICQLQSLEGDMCFYDPVRLTISKQGRVSGEALKSLGSSEILVSVTGKIASVRRTNAGFGTNAMKGRLLLNLSDGTTIQGDIAYSSGGVGSRSTFYGSARNGGYWGDCPILSLD